jgi:lipopolysaccharide transport system permease protein
MLHESQKKFSCSPVAPLLTALEHRKLIMRLVWRDILARYRGSLLGVAWSVITPLILLTVYTFVFSVVFNARWEDVGTSASTSKTYFAAVLFAGLIVFNIFSETIVRAPTLVLNNVSYVKKVVFPLEILPTVSLLVSLFNAAISFVILAVFYTIAFGVPPLTALAIPIIVLPLIIVILGVSLFLASLGVFVRDLQQFMGVVTMVFMFLTPLFYPLSALPAAYQGYVGLSPITISIESVRQALFKGTLPEILPWSISFGVSLLVWWLGFVWFQKTRKAFADVV